MGASVIQFYPNREVGEQLSPMTDRELFSVFQPIYSFSNQACIGAEALIRGRTSKGRALGAAECLTPPSHISAADYSRTLNWMHLLHWQKVKPEESWLFLNLDFANLQSLDDFCLGDLLTELKIKGHEIVIEIVESEIADEALFERLIGMFREIGCLIALDDFGAGHSNIDRIWKAQPDIVKLDRRVLLEASKSLRSQSILRNLNRLIKEAGSISLMEGIETRAQALMAMDVGIDLVQGFYFARPHESLDKLAEGEQRIKEITAEFPTYLNEKQFVRHIQQRGYEALFDELDAPLSLEALENNMRQISSLSFVKRFFILDEDGYQVSEEWESNKTAMHDILKKGKGLCWKNRRYFMKAMELPGRIYVSNPYRSLIDMQLCLTVSKTVNLATGELYVACFDVFYHDKSVETVQISV